MKYLNQIEVYDLRDPHNVLHRCDTIEQAGEWIGTHGDPQIAYEGHYTIDGTPEAWFEQTGERG